MINCHGLLLIGCMLLSSCKSQEPGTPDNQLPKIEVNYTADNISKFPNPERGFYKFSKIDLATGKEGLSQSLLTSYRKHNITLVMRMFYLKQFRDKPLSQVVLDEIERDFATARRSGVKLIVRFAYSEAKEEPDAPLNIVLQHLDQLKPVLQKNRDVIAIVQAGFIGAWGEWYYTSNNLNNGGARHKIIKKLLEAVPTKRCIQLRTPAYKHEYFKRSTPLTFQEAFKDTEIARVGHHNDCFLASSTDYGTYINPKADKAFLNKDCLFVPIGGETCPPDGVDPATSLQAQSEMRQLRWSYLNEDYYQAVNDIWKLDGGMENIIRDLGYRFQLTSGEYSNKVKPGGIFKARITVKNLGYAPLYNPRLVELILVNSQSDEKYRLRINSIEARFWQPAVSSEVKIEGGLPADIAAGSYKLYLNLPDPEESLYSNPAYSIRLANSNMWEEATGYNNLNVSIDVSPDHESESYTGDCIFEKIK